MNLRITLPIIIFLYTLSQATFSVADVRYKFNSINNINSGLEFGILNVDDNGVKFSVFAVADDNSIYAFYLNDDGIITDKINLEGIAKSDDKYVMLFTINNHVYDQIILLTKLNKKNELIMLDQISATTIDNTTYNFLTDASILSEGSTLKDLDNDNYDEIELDFISNQLRLLVTIIDDKLNLDLTSSYYKNSYNYLASLDKLDEYLYKEYILYGYLSGTLSRKKIAEMLEEHNVKTSRILPKIIDKTVELKNYINDFNIGGDLLISYFTNQATMNNILDVLAHEDKDKLNEFVQRIVEFETLLSYVQLNEVIFSDFLGYLNGSVDRESFEKYVYKSLGVADNSILFFIDNIKELNKALHSSNREVLIKRYERKK